MLEPAYCGPTAASPAGHARLRQSARTVLAWLMTPSGLVWMLIAITLIGRVLLAASMGLGIDESYMVALSRQPRLGYFDHPPIAWWLAWVGGALAGGPSDLMVRLPFITLFACSTWLMYRFGTALYDRRAGVWAAALMNAVPVLGISAGSWVLPDGPLIAALLGACLCFVHALAARDRAWGWWLGCGACFGLAACTKYTAGPVALGVAVFMITEPGARRWLARPQPYVAGLVVLLAFAPVLAWNAAHGWASLLFQGGRGGGPRLHLLGPLTTLAGEALYFLPWIWAPLVVALLMALHRGPRERRGWLLACLALPSILLFEIASLRGHVLFHWAAPATMLALPLLGHILAVRRRHRRAFAFALAGTIALVTTGAVLVGTEVRFNWLPSALEDFAPGRDPDLAAVDWVSIRNDLLRRGELPAGRIVAGTRWMDAGKIDYALGGIVPVTCLGPDPHEYGIAAPLSAYAGHDVLIVAPRSSAAAIRARFGSLFDGIDTLPPTELFHAGRPAMTIPLYLGRRLH